MAISRPLLIALIAAVVALAGFYATQGMGGSGDSSESTAPVVPAEQAQDGAAAKPDEPTAVAAKPQTDTPAKPKTSAAARKAAAAKAAARRRERIAEAGVPPAVARAIERRNTVVLLFRGGGSADDRATARAVAGLRGQRGVAVFSDRIGRLGRYRAVVGDLGISQAPAVVIVDRRRSARVVEGYVDPTTLAQDVADAR